MSDSSTSDQRPKQNPWAGVLPIVVACLLTAVYFRAPSLTARLPMAGHILIRAIVLIVGLTGVIQLMNQIKRRPRLPSWIRLSQHWMTIPLEGWIYLGIMFVLFTGAMLTKQNTLLLVFAFMAGPFVINGWMTFGMLQAAKVHRDSPPRAMQGELFSVELKLQNSRPLLAIWMMSLRDEIDHAFETLTATVLFSRVSPRSSQTGQYQMRLMHRGRYRLGPISVSSRFPLGLVERSRIFPVKGEVLIYPRIGRISPDWRLKLVGATELVSRNQPQRGVFHDDFNRLREFRPGDNPRAIHWRSTARRGELILREFHQNREHTLAVVLDLFQPPNARAADHESVDFALSFVASILVERGRECRDGFLTLIASGARTFRWEGQGHSSSLESLFDGLAVFEAGSASEVTENLQSTLEQTQSTTQLLVITTREGELPYQSLISHRIDVLNLTTRTDDSLLIFDDERQLRSAHPEPVLHRGE